MSNVILSVKLLEIDELIEHMRNRIKMFKTWKPDTILNEVKLLQNECQENELVMHDKLLNSKSEVVKKISSVYMEIEEIINKTLRNFRNLPPDDENYAEEKLLFAEYELDFAMLAVNRALLVSLKAIEAQMSQEQNE